MTNLTASAVQSNHHSDAADNPVGSSELTAVLKNVRKRFFAKVLAETGSSDDTEDILQEFQLRIVTKLHQLKHPQALNSWLRRVLQSVIADHFRKKIAEENMVKSLTIIEPTKTAEEEALSCECIYHLLPTLKDEYREILIRVDLKEETREQAASDLCITTENLRVRLHRARNALRRAIKLRCASCMVEGVLRCQCEPDGPSDPRKNSADSLSVPII